MRHHVYKLIKSTILVFGILLFSVSCSKFDQDFTTNPINEVTIDVQQTSYTAVQFENLQIPVNIASSQPEKATYSYTWKAMTNDSVYIISREKDLNVKMELPPNKYNLQFTVTDQENKLEHHKIFSLTVTGIFNEGWLISHNIGTAGRLSFVRADNRVFDDPAAEINKQKFPGKAIASFYAEIPFYSQYASIHYFTDKGIYRFDPASFLLTGATKNVLPNETVFDQLAYGANLSGTDQYYINNGDVHAGMGSFTPQQITMPFTEGFGGDYKLFPIVINSVQMGTYFYDNKYKRFLQSGYLERDLYPVNGSGNDLYNMANVGKTMIAADKGRASSSSTVFYFVMTDNNGRYFYGLDGDKPSLYQKVENSKCPEFSKATCFATSSVLQHMYYTVDNKIYLYNMVANTAQLLYSFPASTQIKAIKIKRKTSKTLAVATWNGSVGQFHTFDIDDLGNFVNQSPSNTLTGFGDIVHIDLR